MCGSFATPLTQSRQVRLGYFYFFSTLASATFYANAVFYLIALPPILLPLFILFVFAQSLLPGREPLVTAIGEASRGPLTQAMRNYTHKVTLCWTLLLSYFVLSALIFTISAPQWVWSLMVNGFNHLLVGVFFVGEFVYRKHKFPEHNHPGFIEYIKIVFTSNPIREKSGD